MVCNEIIASFPKEKQRKFYNEVYSILVNQLRIYVDKNEEFAEYDRLDFIDAFLDGAREYRLTSLLGFGGKYRSSNLVNYYQEDKTPERENLRNNVNEQLSKLLKQFSNDI